MQRAARVDKNQGEIVQLLRAHGAKVRSVAQLKKAFDILVFFEGKTYVVEIKDGNKPLTEGEIEFKNMVESAGVTYNVVRCADDALKMIGKL
jgi:hypothetical protein